MGSVSVFVVCLWVFFHPTSVHLSLFLSPFFSVQQFSFPSFRIPFPYLSLSLCSVLFPYFIDDYYYLVQPKKTNNRLVLLDSFLWSLCHSRWLCLTGTNFISIQFLFSMSLPA
ncbi:hypothetical protein NW754_006605 [Fusarium falciforme]|nr:hypothetical protein NW754_006605 [Fusarium falciforme]